MEKRYQVFVSSTYEDLKEERNEVMKALLELDCIPTAMELFPAADEDSWSLIRRVIDECDYYVLVVGGRYGSLDSEGMGFTEKEYRYAAEKNKPRLVFLPKDPGKIQLDKTDQNPERKQKLDAFIEFLKSERNYKTWTNPDDLGAVLSRSMVQLKNTRPAIGWIRADQASTNEQKDEIIRLRRKIEELEKVKKDTVVVFKDGELAWGEDEHQIAYTVHYSRNATGLRSKKDSVRCTWNELFKAVAPDMTQGNFVHTLRHNLERLIKRKENYADSSTVVMSPESFAEIQVQFLALGFIEEKRASSGHGNIAWFLTAKGRSYLQKIMAVRKDTPINSNDHP